MVVVPKLDKMDAGGLDVVNRLELQTSLDVAGDPYWYFLARTQKQKGAFLCCLKSTHVPVIPKLPAP